MNFMSCYNIWQILYEKYIVVQRTLRIQTFKLVCWCIPGLVINIVQGPESCAQISKLSSNFTETALHLYAGGAKYVFRVKIILHIWYITYVGNSVCQWKAIKCLGRKMLFSLSVEHKEIPYSLNFGVMITAFENAYNSPWIIRNYRFCHRWKI